MEIVSFENSMSLDGFVAGPHDGPANPLGDGGERLFAWYSSGDTPFTAPGNVPPFKISRASADLLRQEWSKFGAMVCGRRMFDITAGWGGNPPGGGPCFVVTHTIPPEWVTTGSPFTFVTDGVESAIRQARQAAGGKNVSVASASIAQQCLRAGLLDEIQIDLVPVLLDGGVRLFENLGDAPIHLESTGVIEGTGVTHLRFRVVK
jgi:dihydrofolate reductase